MLQWLGRATGETEILADLPPGAKILVFSSGRTNPFDGCDLLAGRQPIAQKGPYRLFGISASELARPLPLSCLALPDTAHWIENGVFPSLKTNIADPDLWMEHFDGATELEGFRGKGAARLKRQENNYFYRRALQAAKGDTLVVSFWARIRADQLPQTMVGMEQKNAAGEVEFWAYDAFTDYIVGLDSSWAFIERAYPVAQVGDTAILNITRWKAIPPTVDIDRLMVRNQKTQVWEANQGWIWLNNFPIKRSDP
jgi:hypothetical protein